MKMNALVVNSMSNELKHNLAGVLQMASGRMWPASRQMDHPGFTD
jgi:hypothetical protein